MQDDAKLGRIGKEFSSGQMSTVGIKAELIKVLTDLVLRHQAARAQVSGRGGTLRRMTSLAHVKASQGAEAEEEVAAWHVHTKRE